MENKKENSFKLDSEKETKKDQKSNNQEISIENELFDMWIFAKKHAENKKNNKIG